MRAGLAQPNFNTIAVRVNAQTIPAESYSKGQRNIGSKRDTSKRRGIAKSGSVGTVLVGNGSETPGAPTRACVLQHCPGAGTDRDLGDHGSKTNACMNNSL